MLHSVRDIPEPVPSKYEDFVAYLKSEFDPIDFEKGLLAGWMRQYGRRQAFRFFSDTKVRFQEVLEEAGYTSLLERNSPMEFRRYRAFHYLIGSTVEKHEAPLLDFPEPYSAVTIMRKIKNAEYPDQIFSHISSPNYPKAERSKNDPDGPPI